MSETIEEAKARLVGEYRTAIAKLPWPVRLAWRGYCRIKRKAWQEADRREMRAQMERIRGVVAGIRREAR